MDDAKADLDGEFADVSSAVLQECALAYLDEVTQHGRMLVAEQYRTLAEIVRGAPAESDLWVGPDPSAEPGWEPPHDMTLARWRRERSEFATRAAVSDLAVRVRLSESTVRIRAARVETLRQRCPRLWSRFLGGAIVEQNAMTAAQFAGSLPENGEAWEAFDEAVTDAASQLTPAKFGRRARAVRERVHAESVDERHARAARDRGVWLSPECDGMSTLTALLPAVDAQAMIERLDTAARHLQCADGEERTLDQLRADALSDLVATGVTESVPATIRASVAITVPVLTLLGVSDEPATLDGYGPIDIATARRIAGSATSWVRVLTHPVTGTVLDVDRATYRPPADLRRWVERHHPTCAFPGCGRSSTKCELDHKHAWADGGVTAAANLHPLCRPHHRVRHGTAWEILPGIGEHARHTRWRSPTGHLSTSDPPPF